MAENHSFRSAFHGFNREDVVRYIEYLNLKHNNLVNQLKSENQALKDELEAAQNAPACTNAPQEQETCEPNAELEAYRRAERTERAAKERAEQIYFQATATLAEAATQVEEATKLFDTVMEQINAQAAQLHEAVESGKNALQDAANTMYAIRPESEEAE